MNVVQPIRGDADSHGTEHRTIVDTHRHPIGPKLAARMAERGLYDPKQEFPDSIKLSTNPRVRSAVEGALAPLGTEDIERISFKENDTEITSYDDEDAKNIISSFDLLAVLRSTKEDDEPDKVTAWLRVYSPVYDEHADKWRFLYGDHPIYADISETTIARNAIARGGALVNDLYKVRMEVTQHVTKGGQTKPEYKIVKVLDFKPAPQQPSLPFDSKD